MIVTDRFRVLNLRRLGEHRLRTATSMIGVASGVALIVAMSSLLTSVTATAESTVRLLGGAAFEIVGTQNSSSEVVNSVAAVAGVTSTRRLVEAPVLVDGTLSWLVAIDAEPTGAAPAKSILNSREARELAAVVGVAGGSKLALGEHRVTGLNGRTNTVEITAASRLLRSRYGGHILVADMNTALRLRGIARPDSLLVFGTPTEASLVDAVGNAGVVQPVRDRVTRAKNTIQLLFSSLSILGAMGLIVGGFLMFNTMNTAVLDRRRDMATLRSLGSDRRSIWRGILGEAFVLGVLGSALGVVLGMAMARGVVALIPDAASRVIGTQLSPSTPWWLLVAGFVFGVATSLIATISPAKRTLQIEPLEALRSDIDLGNDPRLRVHPIPLAAGLVLALGVAFTENSTVPPWLALASCVVALLLIVAGAGQFIVALVSRFARFLGPSGELAAISLQRSPRRVWATTATVIVSIAIAVTTTGLLVNFRSTATRDAQSLQDPDFWIGTTPGDTIAVTGLPTTWTNQLRAIPGVRKIAATRWLVTETGGHIVGVQGVFGDSSYSFTRLAPPQARANMLAGRGAIVIRGFATTFHVEERDMISIPGATPPLRLPIVAVTNGVAPNSGGMVNISHDLFAKHFGIDSFARYEIIVDPSANKKSVRIAIDRVTKSAGFPVKTYTGKQFYSDYSKASDQLLSMVAMILLVIVLCAGIAVLNTLLASVLERERELGVLRAIGATQKQLVRSVVREGLAIGVVGSILGAVFGALFHWVAVTRIGAITLFHVAYRFSIETMILAVVSGVAIAYLGAFTPARRVAKMDLLNALAS